MNINRIKRSERDRFFADIRRILSQVAINLMKSMDNPYVFKENDIERNGTSRKKTMRLFSEANAFQYAGRTRSEYGYGANLYSFERAFKEHAEELAVQPTFPEQPPEVTSALEAISFHQNVKTDFRSLETMGFWRLTAMRNGGAIWVYHHPEDYYFVNGAGIETVPPNPETSDCYPKALLKNRQKAVLRALIKKFSELDFKAFIERNLGGNFEGQTEIGYNGNFDTVLAKTEHTETLRNFERYPVTLQAVCMDGPLGYKQEYDGLLERARMEAERIQFYMKAVEEFGGFPALKKAFIKESVQEIIMRAPTLVNGKAEDQGAASYLLNHSDLLTYEYLYEGEKIEQS